LYFSEDDEGTRVDEGLGVVGRPHSCMAPVGLAVKAGKLIPAEEGMGGADDGSCMPGKAVTGELR